MSIVNKTKAQLYSHRFVPGELIFFDFRPNPAYNSCLGLFILRTWPNEVKFSPLSSVQYKMMKAFVWQQTAKFVIFTHGYLCSLYTGRE